MFAPHRIIAALGLFAMAVALTGCGAMRAAASKQQFINEQMKDYVYDKPLAEVWPDARTVLFENNFQVRDTGEAGGNTLETEWNTTADGTRTRYLVQGLPVEGGARCKLRFNVQAKTGQGQASGGRDYTMEWRLVQKIEPDRAAKIEADAAAAGEAARGG